MSAASSPSDRSRGIALMLASALGFSVMSLLVKLAGARLPAMEIVFARSLFMGVVSGSLVARVGGPLFGHDRGTLFLRGAVGAVALSLLYWGLGRLPLGDAITIHYTAPVWTALLAALLLGERLRAGVVVGVASCLTGVLMVAQPTWLFGGTGHGLDRLAVAAVCVAAVLSGLAYTFVRKLRTTDTPLTIIFALSWVGAVLAVPFGLAGGWLWPTPAEWAVLCGVGVATYVGQWALTHGLRRLEAGLATAIGYVQIVLAFVWGLIVFGERPDAWSIAGALVVVASVGLLAVGGRTRRRSAA